MQQHNNTLDSIKDLDICIHKGPLMGPTLNSLIPVHTCISYFLKFHLSIILPCMPTSPNPFSSNFLNKILCIFLISPTNTTATAYRTGFELDREKQLKSYRVSDEEMNDISHSLEVSIKCATWFGSQKLHTIKWTHTTKCSWLLKNNRLTVMKSRQVCLVHKNSNRMQGISTM